VSAHLNSEGYERNVLDLALSGKLRMFVSEAILAEYESVLRRPKFRLKPASVSRSLRLLRSAARTVAPYRQINISRDPGDNRFLECAEAAKADYLVTGNKRHFPKHWRQTLIVNARELLEWTIPDMKR
jgi:putative PIN family toxin of toxin-antitoxin system